MDIRDKGIQTQLRAIEQQTGQDFEALKALVLGWDPLAHTEARNRAQALWGLSLMHAETLILCARHRDQSVGDAAREWYTGPKAAFLPLHEKLMAEVQAWEGVEAVPKKGYLSLRVKKQFATWGPVTNTRFEVGLNGKFLTGGARLQVLPPGGICHFKVVLSQVDEVDAELLGWLRAAWEGAR